MINDRKVAKSLRDRLDTAGTDLGITVLNVASTEEIGANETVFVEQVLNGDITPVGMEVGSNEWVISAYRVEVRTPLSSGNRWTPLSLIDSLRPYFPKGDLLEFEGQQVKLSKSTTSEIFKDDTHRSKFLTVTFTVIA